MFPIHDHNPSGRVPYVTYALIALNVGVFLAYWPQLHTARAAAMFFDTWGVVPYRVSAGRDLGSIVTSMFLHGGWMHLLGNMLFLWIFGDNMEDSFGHVPFAGFYLACGAAAALAQVAGAPQSPVPMVGASGAIAGVMGGYLLLFPRAKIDVLFIFIIFFKVFVVPAWLVLGVWFGVQLFSGIGDSMQGGGVAYLAHVGGFAAGLLLTLPTWIARGGPRFWQENAGTPPHPAAEYVLVKSRVPVVRRRRR